jgi:hypothetical protein
LTLYAVTGPLSMEAVKKLRQRLENATTTVICPRRLRRETQSGGTQLILAAYVLATRQTPSGKSGRMPAT